MRPKEINLMTHTLAAELQDLVVHYNEGDVDLVRALKGAGLAAPTGAYARALQDLHDAGDLAQCVLLGTAAFQAYGPLFGYKFGKLAKVTQPIEINLDVKDFGMPEYIRRVPASPWVDYLSESPIALFLLVGRGIPAYVPEPARFAVHRILSCEGLEQEQGRVLWEILQREVPPNKISPALDAAELLANTPRAKSLLNRLRAEFQRYSFEDWEPPADPLLEYAQGEIDREEAMGLLDIPTYPELLRRVTARGLELPHWDELMSRAQDAYSMRTCEDRAAVRDTLILLAELTARIDPEPPVVVGDYALEIITRGSFRAYDIHLAGNQELLGHALENLGFEKAGRHYVRESMAIQLVEEYQGRTCNLTVDSSHVRVCSGLALNLDHVRICSLEDLVVYCLEGHRLGDSDMLMWAGQVLWQANQLDLLDMDYLQAVATAQGVLDALGEVLNAQV